MITPAHWPVHADDGLADALQPSLPEPAGTEQAAAAALAAPATLPCRPARLPSSRPGVRTVLPHQAPDPHLSVFFMGLNLDTYTSTSPDSFSIAFSSVMPTVPSGGWQNTALGTCGCGGWGGAATALRLAALSSTPWQRRANAPLASSVRPC
jgi:hypothetical protein